MNGEGVTDELGEDGGGTATGLHDALLTSLVHSLDLFVQGRQNVRALLSASRHCSKNVSYTHLTVDSQTGAPRVKVNVFCAKPGIVIGKGGAETVSYTHLVTQS